MRKTEPKDLHAILLVSRNKDNKHLDSDFKTRKFRMLVDLNNPKDQKRVEYEWSNFKNNTQPQELVRKYVSINSCDELKIIKKLQHALIDDEVNVEDMQSKMASLAMKCPKTHKWLLDWDGNEDRFNEMLKDLREYFTDDWDKVEIQKTIDGYHVITPHGFDVRKLSNKYSDEELTFQKNESNLVDWYKNSNKSEEL